MLDKIIVDVLKKYNDANLDSEVARETIAKEVCSMWSKQDGATKEA